MTTKPSSFQRLALAAAVLAPLTSAMAQNAKTPPNPRLSTPPTPSAWEIDYQYAKPNPYLKPPDPSQAAEYAQLLKQFPRLQSIQVTKGSEGRKEVSTLDNGTEQIRWFVGSVMILEDPKHHTYNAWDEKLPGAEHFSKDFESLSAIDKYSFKGEQSYKGTSALLYAAPDGTASVYVDTKTALPIAVQQENVTQTYTFTPATQPLEIPAPVKARIQQYYQATQTSPNP